jgi:hypothetical protein
MDKNQDVVAERNEHIHFIYEYFRKKNVRMDDVMVISLTFAAGLAMQVGIPKNQFVKFLLEVFNQVSTDDWDDGCDIGKIIYENFEKE